MASDAAPPGAMSIAEWAALDNDVAGELVDGLLEEEETPSALHAAVAAIVLGSVSQWVAPRGGMAFGPELERVVRERRERKADPSLHLPGRALPGPNAGATRHARAPSSRSSRRGHATRSISTRSGRRAIDCGATTRLDARA